MQANSTQRLDDPFYRGAIGRNIVIIFGCLLLGLSSRLFYLQIIKGSYHQKLSEQNSMRLQIVHAPRGLIYDRNGGLIARNRPSYQVAILPTRLKEPKRVLANLMRFHDSTGTRIFDSALVVWSLERGKWKKFQPLVILEDASPEIVAMVEEHQLDLPGVVTVMDSRRSYPHGYSAAHVIGYMDEIKEEELESFAAHKEETGDSLPYSKGDRIGRKGLEKTYEPIFRGKDGVRYIKVNAFGKEMEVIKEMPQVKPVPGSNLITTLDMDLQFLADSLMGDSVRGAVVAIDPRNGDVLVMASSPRMDANIFSLSRDKRSKEWAKLALDPAMPLNNRATVGGYEPGSTWKGIMNIAGLQSGKITPTEKMAKPCLGGYRFGNRFWRCWDPKGHGSLAMIDAFTESCDAYYYQEGLIIGMDIINKVAREFGFGDTTGIDVDEERSGMLVDSASYTKRFHRRGWTWTRGLVLNLSIGQGQIATPLQLANYAAGLGNGKVLYRPHLIKEIRDRAGNVLEKYQPQILHELTMTEEQHQVMLKAMESVVNSAHGTGGRARLPDVIVGGKTGSAENPHGGKTHALFIGVAPLYQPELAIAVVLENVGHGGSIAAPIAGAIFREYFKRKMAGESSKSFDVPMLVTLGLIILIGLSTVYSATWDEPGKHWLKQIMYVVMGIIAMGGIYLVPPKIFYAMAYPAWVLSLFPLLYIIIFKANSVERWIALPGGFNLQPSELTKVALLLAMARLLSFQPMSLSRPKSVIAPFLLFIFPFILVLNQPNLSTALSFVAMTTVMAYWSGLTFREIFLLASPVISVALTFHQLAWALMFIVLIGIIIVSRINLKVAALLLLVNIVAGYGAIFVWNKVLYEHQRGRIMTFMDPQRDPLGAGYQVLQSKVAIGSGGLLGKGFLNGTQTNLSFLPEEHTDFIFSVFAEQFGFLGCMGVLALYLYLLHRILRVGSDVRNSFVSLVAVGVAGILGFHIIVNVSMTIGLMPVTGLPLPFMSYGGSFIISCLLMVGLLVNLRAHGHNL